MAHSALSGAGSGELGELRLLPFYDEPVGILFTKSLSASPGYFRGVVGTSSRNVTVESSVTTLGIVAEAKGERKSTSPFF